MTKKILHVVTNIAEYSPSGKPTGLWLGELTHAYDLFEQENFTQDIVSPLGGLSPLEPKSLTLLTADKSVKNRLHDAIFMEQLNNTLRADEVKWQDYDAIYYTGGHAVMWDFLNNPALQNITKNLYEANKIIASVCHGYCGLLNVKLSNDQPLIQHKNITGFSWQEEILAGASRSVPYNAEKIAKQHGANFKKHLLPFFPYIVTDGNIITGQNPASAKLVAKNIIQALNHEA